MAASRRPINVEVSQLFTKLIDSSDEIDAGSTARGHAAIAGTASTSDRLVIPAA
jgi:hypothetical protein